MKRNFVVSLLEQSLDEAAKEQGLHQLRDELWSAVPDIVDQYSCFKVDTKYLEKKIRNMHAFQVSLVSDIIGQLESPTIVDIGDSAGTHLQYLLKLNSNIEGLRLLSVNLDKQAVERIKAKGLEAVCCRAENLEEYDINADIFLCFETLEHLMDPCRFLHTIAEKTKAKYFIITVPFRRISRVGLNLKDGEKKYNAENVHVFEFSDTDWKKIFRFAGWRVEQEKIYYQYPKRHWLRITKGIWRDHDFEGFYGVRLVRDNSLSSLYQDW